ncbi:unnamed protein product [Orchesella dallaii]|uniref:Uncharacterized protein n=1 Tax=Orchesella dallaii TaxID=48710 RepID=A0ABP1PS69_9HEXA
MNPSFVVNMSFNYLPVPPLHLSGGHGVILLPQYYGLVSGPGSHDHSSMPGTTILPYIPTRVEVPFPTPPPAHQNLIPIYRSSSPALSLVKPKANYQKQPSRFGTFVAESQALTTPLKPYPSESTSIPPWTNWMNRRSENLSYLESRPMQYPRHLEYGPRYLSASYFSPTGASERHRNQDPEWYKQSLNRVENWRNISREQENVGKMTGGAVAESTNHQAAAEPGGFVQPFSTQIAQRLDKQEINGTMSSKPTMTNVNSNTKSGTDDTQGFLEEMAKLRTVPLSVNQHLEMMDLLNGILGPTQAAKPNQRYGKMRQPLRTSYSLKRFYTDIVLRRFKQKQDRDEGLPHLISEGKKQYFESQMKWVAKINPYEFRKYFLRLVDEQSRKTANASFVIGTAEHFSHSHSRYEENMAGSSGSSVSRMDSTGINEDGKAHDNTENSAANRHGLLMNGGGMQVPDENEEGYDRGNLLR